MNFWKTGSFAHSKLPVILFSTTAVHNFIPKNTFSRMLAALCDTSQIHLYGSTCSQHNHPSPLCTFGADPSEGQGRNGWHHDPYRGNFQGSDPSSCTSETPNSRSGTLSQCASTTPSTPPTLGSGFLKHLQRSPFEVQTLNCSDLWSLGRRKRE